MLPQFAYAGGQSVDVLDHIAELLGKRQEFLGKQDRPERGSPLGVFLENALKVLYSVNGGHRSFTFGSLIIQLHGRIFTAIEKGPVLSRESPLFDPGVVGGMSAKQEYKVDGFTIETARRSRRCTTDHLATIGI